MVYDDDITLALANVVLNLLGHKTADGQAKSLYMSMEIRKNFVLSAMDVVSPSFNHLSSVLLEHEQIEAVKLLTDFPQCFEYDRNPALVLIVHSSRSH